ncbi:MAG: Stealth CR1 domain-containing protein, partial [Actinomycetota bacterium]
MTGLVGRYRVDRRLPPTVLDFFRTTRRLRRQRARDLAAARRAPAIGDGSRADLRIVADRRVTVAGPTEWSAHHAALDAAERLCSVASDAGIRPFLVERLDDRLRFGVLLDDRAGLLRALASAADRGDTLEWHDRGSSGLVALADAASSRRAGVARRWTIFTATEWGERATGPERGVVVSFYTIGTSGQYELVGHRGHDRFDPRCAPTTETIDGRTFPGNSAYPLGSSLAHVDHAIDVVYTWVDGADPAWQEAFRSTAAAFGRAVDEASLDAARYRSRDELRYSLRSIAAHCGWVHRVWVVTAGQRPEWLVEDDRLRIVD